MPDTKVPPLVFISASGRDKDAEEELRQVLLPIDDSIRIWNRGEVPAGGILARKIEAIEAAIKDASVGVILVSQDCLGERELIKREFPQLAERHRRDELLLLPIVVRSANWANTKIAFYRRLLPRGGLPLSELSREDRDHVWKEVVEVISAHVRAVETGRGSESIATAVPSGLSSAEPGTKKFFISYAEEDGEFAEQLERRMKEERLNAWLDTSALAVGMKWREEIENAIRKSKAVIVVLSPESSASEHVTKEWELGLELGRAVVPLLLKETQIHPRLEPYQLLDFRNRRARPWTNLFNRLREI